MKKYKRAVSAVLAGSMLMSLCSCSDKNREDILDTAEDIANYVCDRDYTRLANLSDDGDQNLKDIFDAVEANAFSEIVASTLTFEFEESAFKKTGKEEYTVDVTFSYVDYEAVLEDEDIVSADDFEDAVEDCDEVFEEEITLEFEMDGSKIRFANIEDLEELFPYWDENLGGAAGATVSGVCYEIPDTDIVFHVPGNYEVSDFGVETDPDSDYFSLCFTDPDSPINEQIMINKGMESSCYSDDAIAFRDYMIESMISDLYSEYDSEISYLDLTIGDYTYEGALATITGDSGSTRYMYMVEIGNEDVFYDVIVVTSDLDRITDLEQCFTVV